MSIHSQGGVKITGWMQSGELQRGVVGDSDWLAIARLRGKSREGWSVEEHCWVGSACPAVPGHGLRGAVAGWCLPVQVVDEEQMNRGGVRVVVIMRRVAVGRPAGGFDQAVWVRSTRGWHRHNWQDAGQGTASGHIRSEGAGRWWHEGRC